jgi:OOP family OmpA-OmpF porin
MLRGARLPAALTAALCVSSGLGDLAWLDWNVARIASADGAPRAAAPPPSPLAPAPLTLSAGEVPAPEHREAAPAPPPRAPTEALVIVRYRTAASALDAEQAASLAPVLGALTRDASVIVLVDGHADRRGASAMNQALSEARAAGVARWLCAHGAPAARVRVRGFGAARPVDDETTEDALGRNRRVEVHFEAKEP